MFFFKKKKSYTGKNRIAHCFEIEGNLFFKKNWDSLHTRLHSHYTKHEVTRKRCTKWLKHTGNMFRKNLKMSVNNSRIEATKIISY